MLRRLCCLFVMVGCGHAQSEPLEIPPQDPRPCDPAMREEPIDDPEGAAMTCGDGEATTRQVHCRRRYSVGCGTEGQHDSIECDEEREECDGADVRGETCEERGFASGDLGCSDTCVFDESACELHFTRPGLACISASFPDADWSRLMLVPSGRRVAVIGIDDARRLTGVFIDRQLRVTEIDPPLAEGVYEALVWQNQVVYLKDDGSIERIVPATRRVQPMGVAERSDGIAAYLAVESDGPRFGVLVTNPSALLVFDASGARVELTEPAHFAAPGNGRGTRFWALPLDGQHTLKGRDTLAGDIALLRGGFGIGDLSLVGVDRRRWGVFNVTEMTYGPTTLTLHQTRAEFADTLVRDGQVRSVSGRFRENLEPVEGLGARMTQTSAEEHSVRILSVWNGTLIAKPYLRVDHVEICFIDD